MCDIKQRDHFGKSSGSFWGNRTHTHLTTHWPHLQVKLPKRNENMFAKGSAQECSRSSQNVRRAQVCIHREEPKAAVRSETNCSAVKGRTSGNKADQFQNHLRETESDWVTQSLPGSLRMGRRGKGYRLSSVVVVTVDILRMVWVQHKHLSNSANVYLNLPISPYVNFLSKEKTKPILNSSYFGGKYASVCNLLWNA